MMEHAKIQEPESRKQNSVFRTQNSEDWAGKRVLRNLPPNFWLLNSGFFFKA
jgi:hypothetical protein